MAPRSRIVIFGSLLTPVALYLGASATMDHFDREGGRFFNTGKHIVTDLRSMAKALQSKDAAGIESVYAPDFSGSPLGLNRMEQSEEKDGIRKYRFRSQGSSAGRAEAVAEWRTYLDGFDSIEEAALHIHRLENWKSPSDVVASVRFELIGTPRGARLAG